MPQLPEYPQQPQTPPVEYGAIFGLAIMGAGVGLLAFLPVFIILPFTPFALDNPYQGGSNSLFRGLIITGAVIGFLIGALIVASQLSQASDARHHFQRQKAAYEAAVAENARELERHRARYVSAYMEYLPKWQAWRKSMEAYNKQRDARQAWLDMLAEYERRAKQAALALDRLYHAVDTRARVQLGITNKADIYSLYREAVSAASQAHPDFGLLRLPRWQEFLALAPLEPATYLALPPLPQDVLKEVPEPIFPPRPESPRILVFPDDINTGLYAPLPVESVRFT
jgi:hypothetical protein